MAFPLDLCLVGIGYAQCYEDNGGLSEDRPLGMHAHCSARQCFGLLRLVANSSLP